MKIDWSWTGAIGALLDRAMGKMLKPPALTRAQKGLPFHKWPGYPGPKAPGKTDGEPVHVVKPVLAARIAAARARPLKFSLPN